VEKRHLAVITEHCCNFEDDMNYEIQQAYKIFTVFLLDKHKGITSTFLHPIGHHDAQHGIEGVQGQVQAQLRQSMCLRHIEEKFVNQAYENITEFVADFRLMLENCYRYYGVDHWISKQAQKLEIMLEQKLTLLSRVLREKTSLAVTSKGRFGAEEERGCGGTSTRRRQASRYLATITGSGHESIMVRTLRQEEQQRVKEEKRQRELEKKEAEEMSAKEVEEWEQSLLSQASPHTVGALWELPAIGHFLCLAQTALNLPEIVFFELERCLLMPRCSPLLSKVMSSLLSPPQRRATLQRRPALPYRRWESELRQRVMGWYRAVGAYHNQPRRAEQLGLCHQFFSVLGEVSPLEEKPFHLLPFYQRVWLLKGLCDHVYETQKDVQDAVLAQPIHECRESILGYDSKENAYIHFPHFCGADLRIYCQSPSAPPVFPFPSVLVRRVEIKQGTEEDGSDGVKSESDQNDACDGADPCLNVAEHSYTGRSPSSPGKLGVKMEEVKSARVHQTSPCSDCLKRNFCDSKPPEDVRCCGKSRPATHLSFEMTQNLREEMADDKIWNKKKKRKKNRTREQLPGVKGEQKHLHSLGPLPCEAAKSAVQRVTTTIKRKDKKKKYKTGCAVLDKALYKYRPFTITQILNGNIKKLKHFYIFFNSHQFVFFCPLKLVCSNLDELRELISKTEDELDELESMKKRLGRWYYKKEAVKELHSTLIRLLNELLPWEPKLVKAYQRNRLRLKKEYDDFKKHPEYNNFVREECVSSSSSSSSSDEDDYGYEETDSAADKTLSSAPSNHLKLPVASNEKGFALLPGVQGILTSVTSTDWRRETRSGLISTSQSGNLTWAAGISPYTSASPTSPILNPTCNLPPGYTPIPTLLAKSVGNKVTLMRRPTDFPGGLPKTALVNPPAHSVMDKKTVEKVMQQVVFLPFSHLVEKNETKATGVTPQQSNALQVPVSKGTTPVCISTDVPGFSIPDGKIPVQQVAPLTDSRTPGKPAPSTSPILQQRTPNSARLKGAQVCTVKASTLKGGLPTPSIVTAATRASTAETVKFTEPKQELKTVCIRDSQSILVTTRGGNTGIVKVQTSSEQNSLGSFPTSPVITISPQLKAFLVSKTSTTRTASVLSHVPGGTTTSTAQTQKHCPSVLTAPHTATISTPTAITSSAPVRGLASKTTGTAASLSRASCISPVSSVAVPLLGKTTTVGQTVCALSHSPSKASSVPISGSYSPTTAGLVPITNLFTIANCSPHLDTRTSFSAVSPIQGVPSTSVISQTCCPSFTTAILPAENIKRKELLVPASKLSGSCPAQVTTTNYPAQTSTTFLDQKPLHIKSGRSEAGPPSCNKTLPLLSSAPTTFSTSTSGPVTQRIILNTSTHLTAGSQIVLNNACFIVPPQGLGPGSHVLLISNSAPQVPAATSTCSEAFLPPKGSSPIIVSPQAPVLPQSAVRLPSMATVGSPFVACTGQSLLAGTPHVTPFRLTGTPGLGSSVIPSKTNVVSALPRLSPAHGCNFGLPPVCTSTLISSPPRLASVPILASPVKTTAPSLGSGLTTIRVTGGSATPTNISSTISTSLSRLSGPLSSLPGLPSSSTGALHYPVTPFPAALHCSPSGHHVDAPTTLRSVICSEQTAVKVATSSTAQPQGLVQAASGKMPLKTMLPVVQSALSGARTQELPTVAVPPILSTGTRTQALPIATVPPIGSTICTFEMASAASAPPVSTTLTSTPPDTSLMTKSSITPPVILTNQAFQTNSVQTSLGMHANLPSKLLTSTDDAVLSTDQCQVNQPEKTLCPKAQDALVVTPNSSGGVLRTHDSTLQTHHGD
uniref:Bromo domain-containing protein n=1 Tax=Xiphophorus couchianus TaxID=32473 RepID=A0A3B5KUM8_9TELE